MLMSRLGGNGAGAFVGSLYDGNIRLGAEFFKDALAELLGVSVKTVYRWAIAGDLPALRIRHTLRIDGAAIEDVYQRQQEEIKGGRRGCSGLPLFLGWPLPANKEGDWSAEIP